MNNSHFSKKVLGNSRNKSSVFGFQYETGNLVCFAKKSDTPNVHEKLRKSVT